MAKPIEQARARVLRGKGKSITEIAQTLQVSKSTVSYWCRDVILSQAQIVALAEKSKSGGTKGLLLAAEKKRAQRIAHTRSATFLGAQDVQHLDVQNIFFLGLGLYWGEGYKRGNEELGFTNSDPSMIQFIIYWLQTIYSVRQNDLIARVSINAQHAHRATDVEHYWMNVVGIPRTQFTKTSLIHTTSKKVYSDPENHYGTLRIKVRRGAHLRRRILGSLRVLQTTKTETLQRRVGTER